jgi:hypothetical protein
MTLLEKTYNITHQKNLDEKDVKWVKPQRPEKEVLFNTFNIPENRQKIKTREYLAKALAFIDMVKRSRFADGYTVLTISVKNKRLLSMFNNSQPRVSMWIDYLIRVGLLAEYNEKYQFNGYYHGKAKQYCYSYDVENCIKEYCINNDINKYQIKNNRYYNNSIKLQTIENFDRTTVKFSSKLNLLKPDNWSCSQFEEYLINCLYENYPALEHYQELADTINDTFYSNDMDRQIQFTPKITWRKGNKCVTSIGIRATNCLVNAKKEHEDNDKDNQLYKAEVFEKYGLKYHYDVKSSVPRLTYFLNTQDWLDNSVDLYEIMFTKFIKYCPSEAMEWNDQTRKIFKDFHMRGYFDTYNKIAAHIKRVISTKTEYKKEEWTDLDYMMKSYKQVIEETIGDLYDNEIFFHESCIYMDVLWELLNRNIEVWQVYDEWNTDTEVSDMYSIIEYKANEYYNKYINKDNKLELYNNSIKLQNREVEDGREAEKVFGTVSEIDTNDRKQSIRELAEIALRL